MNDLSTLQLNNTTFFRYSDLGTTDGVYGILSSADVSKRIASLGQKDKTGKLTGEELVELITKFMKDNKTEA